MIRQNLEFRPSQPLLGHDIPFKANRPLQLIIAVFVVYWGFMAIWPVQRSLWLVENILVVLTAVVLVWTYRYFQFSNLSYLFIALFLVLHTFATHYSYESNPIDTWLKATFHTKRSYYDRIVHFAFGLFWIYPFGELYVRLGGRRGVWPYAVPLAIVVGLSAVFEIIEMAGASISGQGQNSEEFVGMQGDLFDTQKDMMLALFGALVAVGLLVWSLWRRSKVESRSTE